MKLKITRTFLLIAALNSCQFSTDRGADHSKPETEAAQIKLVSDNLSAWVKGVNSDRRGLEKLYHPGAFMVISADEIFEGPSKIAAYYHRVFQVSAAETLFSIEARPEKGISYEVIRFRTKDMKEYKQLVIWDMENEEKLRTFEFAEEVNGHLPPADSLRIVGRRDLWMELCNAHNAAELVNQLYSANTLYYNHKPLVKGRQALIPQYDYMNNKEYALSLEPLTFEAVNADTVIEIGQCKGSYGGKYILIWKKDPDGEWRIFIDSNV